ncbi:glycosyltransferase family 2 protein [Cupriavidus sp. L7L]|uniref:glycosyltransferase family 2 protein n=1 Tax=Cupriavidus sp. L7L TaxID=2546443 RepID=UPI0010569266|nr:glycosyltransferase family 2 protein [Cupriavidus sp. L7L]TDF66161.1 glycosyltransferase family 2 protein [Cupriavidus sp. L7L]
MPKVSVVMPVYNGEKYVRSAIESILAQSFVDFELLVIDDGSTDQTARIIRELVDRDPRVKVIHQANGGIVSALNRGLDLARGKYIARMDADDEALPDRLQLQCELMDMNEAVVACGSFYEKVGAATGIVKMPVLNKQCLSYLQFHSCFAHPTVMIRSATLKLHSLRYRREWEYTEDFKLWLDLSQYGELANIPKVLLNYRMHVQQIGVTKRVLQKERHTDLVKSNLRKIGVEVSHTDIYDFLWPGRLRPIGSLGYIVRAMRIPMKVIRSSAEDRWRMARRAGVIVVKNIGRSIFARSAL